LRSGGQLKSILIIRQSLASKRLGVCYWTLTIGQSLSGLSFTEQENDEEIKGSWGIALDFPNTNLKP